MAIDLELGQLAGAGGVVVELRGVDTLGSVPIKTRFIGVISSGMASQRTR